MNPPSLKSELERRYLDLIERNRDRIRRICRSWSGAVDAEELEAEVFFQLWKALPTFSGQAHEDTWVYRVTLNAVMSASRKERHRSERTAAEETAPEPRVEETVQQRLELEERLYRLRSALGRLPEGALPADASIKDHLRHEMTKVEGQIELLSTVKTWYVRPIAVGSTIFCMTAALLAPVLPGLRLPLVAFMVGTSIVIFWAGGLAVVALNKRAVEKQLRPLRDDLADVIDSLEPA